MTMRSPTSKMKDKELVFSQHAASTTVALAKLTFEMRQSLWFKLNKKRLSGRHCVDTMAPRKFQPFYNTMD